MPARRDLKRRAGIMAAVIGTIWLVGILDAAVFGGGLAVFGVLPRTGQGPVGIAVAPVLHGGMQHLVANTLGILVFGGLTLLRSEHHFWSVTVVGILTSGAGTWLFGRTGIHIGASGVVFAYFGYLLFTGFFERRLGALLLS